LNPQNYTLIATKFEEALSNTVNSNMFIQLNLLNKMYDLSATAAAWGFSFYQPIEQLKLRRLYGFI